MTAKTTGRPFSANYAIPPGESLAEILEVVGLSQADLAERTGRPKKTINEIVKGKAAITPETALQFERVLGTPSSLWNTLEQNYRATLARLEEHDRLSQHVTWLSNFPINEMVKRKLIEAKNDQIEMVRRVLSFFGVASPDAWEEVWCNGREAAAFRQSRSSTTDIGLMATWLRQGELKGREIKCEAFNATRFKAALACIRSRTSDSDINMTCNAMIEECATAGVAVVLVPEFPKLGICGATRWLSSEKALIQLSLHYKKEDQFWFSFFHEAGHILLHGKREIFVERTKAVKDREEDEANKFAADFLIPTHDYQEFLNANDFSKSAIIKFAGSLVIAPSILVGRLQHDKVIGFHERNELRPRLDWAS